MAEALSGNVEPRPSAPSKSAHPANRPEHANPIRMVAHSYCGGPIGLGLDSSMDLRGGDRIGPQGMALELPFGGDDALTSFVATACRSQSAAGRDWFQLPPAVLLGPAGRGRTHIARQIARLAGVPFATLDVGGIGGERRLRSDGRPPDLVLPPLPVLAMAASRCANPVILITGIENVTRRGAENLARMLDPRSNDRVAMESIGACLDFSAVTWLVSATQYGILDHSIIQNAVEVQLLNPAVGSSFQTHVLSVLLEAMADLDVDDAERESLGYEVLRSTAWMPSQRSTSSLYEAATEYLLKWISSVR